MLGANNMGAQLGGGDHEPGQGSGFFGRQGMMTDINITPFVDVILVLLIIFMVTAPFAVSGVNVQMPRNQAKPLSLNGDPVVLSVTSTGEFFLGKTKVLASELTAKLKAAKNDEKEASIYIRADKAVPYGRVAEAMAAAQAAGIRKIGMMGESNGTNSK